ncbi:MAG: hypothetical protein IPJ82_10190 [Lewinellaceae bacterium]|nr:hypothetical protein [Lewinellaceae bacterium]
MATLEAEGFPLGTGAHLRVQELLRGLPHESDDDALCAAMCAILARNPQEQTLIHERFGECATRTDALLEQLKKDETRTAELAHTERQLRRWQRRALIPAVFLLLTALAAGLFFWKEKSEPVVIEKLMLLQGGESKMLCPADIAELNPYGAVKGARVTYPEAAAAGQTAREGPVATSLGSFSLDAAYCFIYTARDTVQGLDSIAVAFNFDAGKTATVAFKVLVEKPESETVKPAQLPGRDTLFKPKNIPYPHDIAECAIQPPPAWQSFLANNLWWLRWAFFLPFTAFLFALWRWLEYRRRKLIAQQERRDQPPYFWNIRIPGADDIVLGDSFAFALQVMRRRASSDVLRLDLSKTIEKTAERGGMPDFRYRQLTRPVDYLLLIERGDPANHRAQLFDALYRAFREQEIDIARYWYDGDIRLCFDEQNPRGVPLQDIAQRFPGARLLVLGNGAQLLSPDSGRPAPWTDVFTAWKERALLTPKPTGEWGLDERRLASLFTLLPATLQGLGFWVDELDVGQDARFEDWQKHVKDAPHSVFQPDADDPISTLMLQFDPKMLRWVAACAIYPSLHWDLTLWMGRQLAGAAGSGQSAAGSRQTLPKERGSLALEDPEESLVTIENLLRLFRIRWFVDGAIPQNARAALLDWLERNDPALLIRLRAALADLLRQNPPPQNSAAYDDYALNIALNEWLAAQDPARKKELEREIARRLEAGARPDFTVLKYLDRPRSALDFVVPEAWKKYVYPAGHPALGWKGRWKDLLWALPIWVLAGVGAFWPYNIQTDECFYETAEVVENGTTLSLCLKDMYCKVLFSEYQTRNEVRTVPIAKVDTTIRLFKPGAFDFNKFPLRTSVDGINFVNVYSDISSDTAIIQLYAEARANLAAELYNRALNYAATQKDSACILFRLAAQLDTLDYDYRRAVTWCEGDKPVEPEIKGRFRVIGQPVAGEEFEVILTEVTPGASYELNAYETINGKRPSGGLPYLNYPIFTYFSATEKPRLSISYSLPGTYQMALYVRDKGRSLRLQTASVVVANEKQPAVDTLGKDKEKPINIPSTTAPVVVPGATEGGGIVDTSAGLPPGRYVVTGSIDNTVKLWTLEGLEINTFNANMYGVNSGDISPDGKYLQLFKIG